MENIKVFENKEFGKIRLIELEGEPWLVGKDVAEVLGYENQNRDIVEHIDEDDRFMYNSETQYKNGIEFDYKILGQRGGWLINESGLYSLIMSSKLPNAKKFKRWITHEVIPSIRKHGMYATDKIIDDILNNPDFGIELLTNLKEERSAREEAERKNAILMHVNKTYTMTEIAKELNLKSAAELNGILADRHIQYKVNNTWVLYSDYSNLGYEDIKQEVLDNGRVIYHRKITQSGREFILGLFEKSG